MTSMTLIALVIFGGCMSLAFNRLRPLFRERGKINAEVTGRLGETLGGIRIVKAYSAEKREEIVFARGAHRLFRNVARSMTGVSSVTAFSTVIIGGISVILVLFGGHSSLAGPVPPGQFFIYISFTVLVYGRDLASIRLRDYRTHLGVVLKDSFLFDGPIAENISFAHPRATREQIVEASRIAHCEEFVNGFESGYDTIVGERGVKLSGGQRQRVAIARAILAEPKILILDEATSSLDSESEALIQDGLQALRRGRTTFVIAHRLSTIRSADQILVLEHGEIVERV